MAQIIGVYAAHVLSGEPTTAEALSKSILAAVDTDGLAIAAYYNDMLKCVNGMSQKEYYEEVLIADAHKSYIDIYALPRLGIAEALAYNSEMPIPVFIKEAFTNPQSFQVGIPEYILDKGNKITAFTGRYLFKSDIINKATVLEHMGREIASEANYVNNKLERN